MELNEKAIVPLDADSGVDFTDALGCSVDADGTLGGDFGVITVVNPAAAGETTSTEASVAVFGGNAGPVEVKLAGTVAVGEYGISDGTTGKFTKAAATDVAQVRFLEAGVADELVKAILLPPAGAVGAEVYAAYEEGT